MISQLSENPYTLQLKFSWLCRQAANFYTYTKRTIHWFQGKTHRTACLNTLKRTLKYGAYWLHVPLRTLTQTEPGDSGLEHRNSPGTGSQLPPLSTCHPCFTDGAREQRKTATCCCVLGSLTRSRWSWVHTHTPSRTEKVRQHAEGTATACLFFFHCWYAFILF